MNRKTRESKVKSKTTSLVFEETGSTTLRTAIKRDIGSKAVVTRSARDPRSGSSRSSNASTALCETTSKKVTSATKKERAVSQSGRGQNLTKDSENEPNDVKFTNVPSTWEKDKQQGSEEGKTGGDEASSSRPRGIITDQLVLTSAQESDPCKVYEINLSSYNIGRISHLTKFTRLRSLDLSCNHIEKIDNISSNTDLRELRLYDNRIQAIEGLECLRELMQLHLQHNHISSIGKGLASLRKLKTLRLDGNSLTRLSSGELSGCLQLSSLDLSSNRLDNLTAINCLPQLEELIVVGNQLKIISDLSRCRQLQDVNISLNKLTDVTGLRGLTKLKTLNLSKNSLRQLTTLGKMTSLTELIVSDNKLTDLGGLVIQLPAIEILDVSSNTLAAWDNVMALSKLSALVELSIHGNPFCHVDTPTQNYINDMNRLLPGLDMLDGVHTKQGASGTHQAAPLMRPMSAASVISARQVSCQLDQISADLSFYKSSLTDKYQSLQYKVDSLLPAVPEFRGETPVVGSRPTSRCRARIIQAQKFDSEKF